MTIATTLDTLAPDTNAGFRPPAANEGASYLAASYQVATRTVKKFARTPQLVLAGTAQGALFLLIFRYVFGGAIGHTGSISYVDFVIPGFVVTSVLFTGMGAATGIAEDLQGGFFDRLRSLPIRLLSIVTGRIGGDSVLLTWSLVVTTAVGVLVGFRVHDGAAAAAAAFGLCLLYGFAFLWLFIALGLLAGNPQSAQALSFLVFPLTFVSSAYVPVATMPGWMQAFAAHQPLTSMCNTVRILTQGHAAEALLGHSLWTYLLPSLLWSAAIVLVFAPLTVHRLRRA
jgi:ABC-2 type transport system permease protein